MRKHLLLATAAVTVIATPAFAQDADTPTDVADNAAVDEAPANAPIIVIAQGREQRLQDVPIAINAVSAEDLQNSGTNDIRELNQLAPSLLVSSTGNEANGSARVRGIGTVGDNPGLESSVAVFVDGVYRSRSGNALGDLGPLERIEVLRGPQGTLFGRNASAGLLNIVTAPPEFDLTGYASASYGSYDYLRFEAGINAPLGDTLAGRIDGVYFSRDGFYNDVTNGGGANDRDRYLVRGQLLFEANTDLSFRLIGDYSNKDEECCAAVFVTPEMDSGATFNATLDPFAGPGGNGALISQQNPIIPILLALGQDPRALTDDPSDRNIYPTAGRSYAGETEDWGVSLEANWDLGGVDLTSITAYREYSNNQGSDTDYTTVDILYRAPGNNALAREFQTFSQELRLQGSAFDDRLDWLIGAYYANEDLTVRDNLRFGTQYGTFASCRIALALVGTFGPGVVDPSQQNCVRPGTTTLLGPLGPALDNLSAISDLGSTEEVYNQQSENFAFFTHNIFHISDEFDLTVGLRYTNENKDFAATFGNDNTICPINRAILQPAALAGNPLAAGILALSCQGNSSSELDGVSIADSRSEEELTGTAILSWRPTDDLLLYGSYSRGYKAGGFNLDRSALNNPLFNPAIAGSTAALQFDQEEVDAFEIGAKYTRPGFSLSGAIFRQEFTNFQLNTFNGSVYLVQNINACGTALNGADRDASAATGACAPNDVVPGVISQGIELEASLSPVNYVNVNLGLTYTDTSYENDLIGNDSGAPLDPALRLLPGDNLSNAPSTVVTAAFSWTPPIGNRGMSGLFYVNSRMTSGYNTGSDLLFGKEQESFVVVNGRVGIRGDEDRWAVEFWAQNIFDTNYTQVAFNTPFVAPQQTISAFLAEPRTYGMTVRTRF